MHKRQLALFCTAAAFLTAFFLLPENKRWGGKIISYWKELPGQWADQDEKNRLAHRFGTEYTYTAAIAEMMRKNNSRSKLLLMPPTNYFKEKGLKYHVPEPAVFYYFTGIKTIWADSPDAIHADLYIDVADAKLVLHQVRDEIALKNTISGFLKAGVTL